MLPIKNPHYKKIESESNQALTSLQKIIQTVENSIEKNDAILWEKKIARKKGAKGNL